MQDVDAIDSLREAYRQERALLEERIERLLDTLGYTRDLLNQSNAALKDSNGNIEYWRETCTKEQEKKKYWMEQYDKLLISTSVTQSKFNAAKRCLADNGIEEDETDTVLQALCYILLDVETEQFMAP
jgi:hypothetical protein